MLSIAVVEDEKAFSNHLSQMLRRWGDAHGEKLAITCFEDGLDIADNFKSRWDIIFLDIQMKLMDGLETARAIRAHDSEVVLIFVTTMAQYAINGYEVDAFDYILKPLSYPQFELHMNKAAREVEKKEKHSDADRAAGLSAGHLSAGTAKGIFDLILNSDKNFEKPFKIL